MLTKCSHSPEVPASIIVEGKCDVESHEVACSSSWHNSSSSDNDSLTVIDQNCSKWSDSSESDNGLHDGNLKTKLQAWAVECNVTQPAG